MRMDFIDTGTMEKENTTNPESITGVVHRTEELVRQIDQYGGLIIESLVTIIGGIFVIYFLHRLAEKFLFPHFGKGRAIKVVSITVYSLILLATALVVLSIVGIDVTGVADIALVIIFIGAVLIFILLAALPKFPVELGHLIEVGGELGTVTEISPLYTRLRKFDGTLVFVPNTSLMTSMIRNYSHIAFRRIEINLTIEGDADFQRTKEFLLRLMSEDERVLDEPSPPSVFILKADSECIDLLAACWVKNEDWFDTKCDIWEKIISTHENDVKLATSLSQLYRRLNQKS